MNDRGRDDSTDRDSPNREDREGRDDSHGGPGGDREPRGGQGADTRFLQLEMSKLMYAEAEGSTKQAFRELLVEAAKARLRERFGDTITDLARLATDELLADMESSLEVEASIQRRHESQGSPSDRLRAVFARRRSDPGQPSAERKRGGASARKRRR
jgi:hypothetical protein